MPAYLYTTPSGVVGGVTRAIETNVEPCKLVAVASVFAQAYGIPLALVPGGVSQWQGSNVAADFAGILVREVPSISGSITNLFNTDVPNPLEIKGKVERGYVMVACTIGTPVRGGIVYIRVVAAAGKVIGDLEATADGVNNIAMPQSVISWATDGKDSTNITPVRLAK